jgi:hypothetical protein
MNKAIFSPWGAFDLGDWSQISHVLVFWQKVKCFPSREDVLSNWCGCLHNNSPKRILLKKATKAQVHTAILLYLGQFDLKMLFA